MRKSILVVGATGNLGTRISVELLKRSAVVSAIVRKSADPEKAERLKDSGITVIESDLDNLEQLAKHFLGVDCVVSAVAGLRAVIVDLQKRVLSAAILAGVPRFIPSDFCTDYNDLAPGENRNFDLRREFKNHLDDTAIRASSIFNGAFADILKYNTPLLNLKDNSVGYWGDKRDWKLDFTTMDETAAFTADVALDEQAPRNLHIASFQITPETIWKEVQEKTGQAFAIRQISGLEEFAHFIKKQRADNPAGENELYAKWQQSQYMYSMFSTHHHLLSNDRYENLAWTTAADYIGSFVK